MCALPGSPGVRCLWSSGRVCAPCPVLRVCGASGRKRLGGQPSPFQGARSHVLGGERLSLPPSPSPGIGPTILGNDDVQGCPAPTTGGQGMPGVSTGCSQTLGAAPCVTRVGRSAWRYSLRVGPFNRFRPTALQRRHFHPEASFCVAFGTVLAAPSAGRCGPMASTIHRHTARQRHGLGCPYGCRATSLPGFRGVERGSSRIWSLPGLAGECATISRVSHGEGVLVLRALGRSTRVVHPYPSPTSCRSSFGGVVGV